MISLIYLGIRRHMPVILLACFALSACSANEPPHEAAPRLVKVETVTAQPPEGLQLIGVVRSQHRADLSFEIGGLLEKILVRAGQDVRKGQTVAQLDRSPAQLKLDQAKAQLASQKQLVLQSQRVLDRSKRLLADGAVARKDVEQATANHLASLAQQRFGEAAVQLAQRDLDATQLKAPFSGRVVSYELEPHSQVAAAQTVIRMASAGQQEVIAQVPVDQARRLSIHSEVLGLDASQPGYLVRLQLQSLSPEAKSGVLQEAKFEVVSPGPRLAEGTAITVQVTPEAGLSAITLPHQAFRGASKPGYAEVFVYEPQTSQVELRQVEVGAASGSRLVVLSGLVLGEQVVTAGAAFLSDRQPVSLFKPTVSASAE